MTGAIGLCTDSSAQLPASVVAAHELEVVPIGITVDGVSCDEGNLDPELFYARLSAGSRATTSQPSPGRFAETYAALAARGVREVLSIHVASNVSGTIGSAELAAREAPVPVTVVDTGTASFGVGVCVLAAAEAIAAGGSAAEAVAAVERLAPSIGNVFVAGAAPGGRVPSRDGLPLLSFSAGTTDTLGEAASLEDAAAIMARLVLSRDRPVRTAVGHADSRTARAAELLATALESSDGAVEVLRYRVGPPVGAHTGPLSFGAFWWPASSA